MVMKWVVKGVSVIRCVGKTCDATFNLLGLCQLQKAIRAEGTTVQLTSHGLAQGLAKSSQAQSKQDLLLLPFLRD